MKNLSLILNAVLLVAVGVLFYLHFSTSRPAGNDTSLAPAVTNIAFINSDSVLKDYEYIKVTRDVLEAKAKKLDQDVRNRAQSFQSEYEAFQRNADNMTQGQIRTIQESLQAKQQNLQLFQQSAAQEMSDEEAKVRQDLYNRITEYLKTYGKAKGLQLVLKFDTSSDLLFGGENLDVTKEVTAGLNDAYQIEKKNAQTKKDSTAAKKK